MYSKKILSATAAVAIMSVGVGAFDMIPGGGVVTDYDGYYDNKTSINGNRTGNASSAKASKATWASYVDGVDANESMVLSKDDRGDALIYPAFRSGAGWETTITVRNTKSVAIIAKAVLYDAQDSHELKDFNLYLSPYDVARFKIKDGNITTRDGSIAAGIDPNLDTDAVVFIKHDDPKNTKGVGGLRFDSDGDLVISSFKKKDLDNNVTAGYVVIYAMTEAEKTKAYHGNHVKLYKDYRKLLNICRDVDNKISTTSPWISVFRRDGGTAINGTATRIAIKAPNVAYNCTDLAIARDTRDNNYTKIVNTMDSNFTTPSEDALFGEVGISHKVDKRSLLLKARAINNYTADNQMMLWSPGEYAAIQDRRLRGDAARNGLSIYNINGIKADTVDMVVRNTYYSFNKGVDDNKNSSVLLLTQPMKRPLIMGFGTNNGYWTQLSTYRWGQFALSFNFYDENENLDSVNVQLQIVTSPVDSQDEKLYQKELTALDYKTITKSAGENSKFKKGTTNGYARVKVNGTVGLPAIVTEMVSENIDGEAQINWIYSAIGAKK
jgi:hypothetical protein